MVSKQKQEQERKRKTLTPRKPSQKSTQPEKVTEEDKANAN